MKKTTKKEARIIQGELAREALREFLVKQTNCEVQGGYVKANEEDFGWPCGTCFMDLLNKMGLDSKDEAYQEANEPSDRHNEVWRAVLQIRDAKLRK